MMKAKQTIRATPPGLLSGVVFFIVVAVGCAYIIYSKARAFDALYVTLVPVAIMIGYAVLLGLARLFRLRDDQSGDNLYYMGFLFTLTSLAVSLYQFSENGAAEQIVQNFGIAIGSTIAGIALRIFFNQMRRDPVEVEHIARLELADASRRVKRELESTVLEFAYFRRTTQQSLNDTLEEMKTMLSEAKDTFVGQLDEFAATSSKPIEEASKRSSATIEEVNARIAKALEGVAKLVAEESSQLTKSTAAITKSIDGVVARLAALQTPDHIIEIKLNPTIQGLSRAVNNFTKSAEAQAVTVDSNLKQTQALTRELTQLIVHLKMREATQPGSPSPPSSVVNIPSSQAAVSRYGGFGQDRE